MKIFLVGISGSGKTAIGKKLARLLDVEFVDTDERIEKLVGNSVVEIFDKWGEKKFRKLELDVVQKLCFESGDRVVATGGGLPMQAACAKAISRAGVVVWLRVALKVAAKRSLSGSRPLLDGVSNRLVAVSEQLARREKRYEKISKLEVDTSGSGVIHIAEELVAKLGLPAKIQLVASGGSCSIVVGNELMADFGEKLRDFVPATTAVVVEDSLAAKYHGASLVRSIRSAGYRVRRIKIEAGERNKSLRRVRKLHDFFHASGVDRSTPVIVLGGGVVGDLAGFAAATWLRGVPLIQIPTTLLAQVDSAIGGKTGVNTSAGKNTVGAFYHARLVWADINTLQTLPAREFRSGLGEVLKYGAAMDRRFFRCLEEISEGLLERKSTELIRSVLRCIELKCRVVSLDDLETKGVRQVLNFGHTVGHALETATHYRRYKHGEAVAIGMVMESRLSHAEGLCSERTVERLIGAVSNFGLPFTEELKKCEKFLGIDKKRAGKGIYAPLLRSIGKVEMKSLPISRWRSFVREVATNL